jgi:hypothetical protein
MYRPLTLNMPVEIPCTLQLYRTSMAGMHGLVTCASCTTAQKCGVCFCSQGPWIENYFFNHFVTHPSLNVELERVYVPICFTDSVLAGKSAEVSQALQVSSVIRVTGLFVLYTLYQHRQGQLCALMLLGSGTNIIAISVLTLYLFSLLSRSLTNVSNIS